MVVSSTVYGGLHLSAIQRERPAQIVNLGTPRRHRFLNAQRNSRCMDRKLDILVQLSPMERERYHSIQENLLEDRVVEDSGAGSHRTHILQESELHLDHIGMVTVTLSRDSLVWQKTTAEDNSQDLLAMPCFRLAAHPHEFPLSEIYAVESSGWGPVRRFVGAASVFLKPVVRMHRFTVYSFQRQRGNICRWVPKTYTFAHPELNVCQKWVSVLQDLIKGDSRRPKSLLVFINPYGGKGIASSKWDIVAPLFLRAGVKTKVVLTERAGHAFSAMYKATDEELASYNGIVVVGGDGVFNEVLNGLALQRHRVAAAPTPQQVEQSLDNSSSTTSLTPRSLSGDSQPLLASSCQEGSSAYLSNGHTAEHPWLPCTSQLLAPGLRIGIIPAGSTDTIVVSTTGSRDPLTAALHIVLGDSMPLDIVRLTGWRSSTESPETRYAASFAGYGFYGDVAKESEELRWMGPARYDFAGTKVFLRHRTYEAEVGYLATSDEEQKKVVCRSNCGVCGPASEQTTSVPKWQTTRGKFLSVGAAIMACRNDKAPDGVVPHAHLSDGMLHLILIKSCSRPAYLRQLIELTRRGGNPLGFDFVEHHKTPLFTFVAHGEDSVWNVDGEIFPARELTGQVFRGLINIFARGPEV